MGTSLGHAEQLPLWEAGAGIGATTLPHYRGSDQSRTWVLPLPYLVYRGESLKVDDRRLRRLFSDKVALEFSLSGSPPVKDNDARRGMPDLDPTLEIGPSLNIALYRSDNRMERLELRLPVRTVFSSDFSHVRQAGWIFQPNLSLDFKNVLGNRGWNLGLQGSLIYADRRYNQYFYAVDPVFQMLPDRPAFNPSGGYAGTAVIAALSKRFSDFWIGGFAKWDRVGGAVADSPLVKSRSNLSGGLGVAWILRASSAKVDAEN